MLFNPIKQAVEILFSKKQHQKDNPSTSKALTLNEHRSNKINKCNKIIGIMKKLSLFLSRKTLVTIYTFFVRPKLDYAVVIYDKPFNESFKTKIEMIQYRVALAINWAIKVHY